VAPADVLFLGAGYRAYVRVGGEVVVADHHTSLARGRVRVIIPRDKVFVSERPGAPGAS
jgi:hypothetical protein